MDRLSEITQLRFSTGEGCAFEMLATVKNDCLLVASSGQISRLVQCGYLDASCSLTSYSDFSVNPKANEVEGALQAVDIRLFDKVIAVGGGSTLDFAKAWCAKAAFAGTVNLVSTTCGTGAEVTPFATLWDSVSLKKYSVDTSSLRVNAFNDPRLMGSLPFSVVLDTGLDNATHALESLWNRSATTDSRQVATDSLALSLMSLKQLLDNGQTDGGIIQNLAGSSLMSGLAIASTKTAICHSMSYPLTLRYSVPHGLAVAFTVSAVFETLTQDSDTGLNGLEIDPQAIRGVFKHPELSRRLRSFLPSREAVLCLLDEMWSAERAENTLGSLSRDDLPKLVTLACHHHDI